MVIILRGIEILTPYASIHYKSEVDISESVILTSNLNASQCFCSGKHGSQQQTDVCMANLGSSECNGLQKQPHCSDAVHSKNVCKPKTFKIPMNVSSFWISNHFFFFFYSRLTEIKTHIFHAYAHSLFSRFFSYIQAKLKTEHDSLGSPRREISIQGLTCCRISVKPGCLFFISSQWFSDSFMYACKSTRSQFIPIATSQVSWKCLTFWTEVLKGRRQTT